ncbi:MAG TPA: CYTH domain-containing protein, partial [Povalibacter sp.]|nr:CYTH domain-containing protein [Povalibacter sp.]
MALEIERKFLVRSDAWRSQTSSRQLLRQGYMTGGSRCSVRARIAGDEAWLNIKAKRSGMTRLEFEYAIPRADAEQMLDELCEGPLLEKYRHRIDAGPYVWEIDEFLG